MPMEDILNEIQECEPVQLEPFIHQVGGHSSILCLDERTVCKPLIKQELKFYETLPNSMKKFTPEYRGVVQVRFEEDTDGYITVAAYPPKSFRYQLSNPNKKRRQSRRIRLKNSGSIEIEIESELSELFVDEQQEGGSGAKHQPSSSTTPRPVRPHNPWALKCHRDHLSKIRRSGGGSTSSSPHPPKEPQAQKFMLLENLTNRFEYPCVLDLKMGTRQYGDDATPAKIESQCAKAASSTSVQLGVRICGMQVYQVTTGKFMCRNKYYGRKLSVDGFREALYQFLHNGKRVRTDALIPLVEKLQELKSVLSNLDTFRFYTSSLLLIYEGLDPDYSGEDDGDQNHDIQMTEEGREKEEEEENIETPTPMDSSEIEEIKSEIKLPSKPSTPVLTESKSIDNILLRGSQRNSIEDSFGSEKGFGRNGSVEGLNSTSSSTKSSRSNLGCSRGSTPSAASLSSESVDVRMIDFAHALHSGLDLQSTKEHPGPDTGYIFGLSNFIKVLQEIIEEESL